MLSERPTTCLKYMKLQNILEQFGLTEKQAKVYLATLELGSGTVNQIADKSNVARPTCYDVLESLKSKGIASTFIKTKTRYFSVEEPDKIVKLAENRAENLKSALPELEAIYGMARNRPKVRFYQGKDGMKQILQEIINDKKDILSISSADDLLEILGDYWPDFIKKRLAQKISVRTILRDTPKARERQKLGPKELRVVKIIPKDFDYHGTIIVFGNKMAFFSFIKDIVSVVIESKELTQVQRSTLEFIWQNAE